LGRLFVARNTIIKRRKQKDQQNIFPESGTESGVPNIQHIIVSSVVDGTYTQRISRSFEATSNTLEVVEDDENSKGIQSSNRNQTSP